ncbi:hypothetical protein PR202_ga03478 [Eleusine coracana subsp. coracana]|uniref:Pentatricopeptide repeat-containing protein n=1 Tax=Eleusine coracana subsp. coracana TaxID=191504 RepID=A0AAV5BP89_ELECO|nr:hypothetical protein PR202_ga03478 [Eleusine coracana subsp. coracana]
MREKLWDCLVQQLLCQSASLSNAKLRQVHAVLLTSSVLADRFFPNKLLRSLLPGQPLSVVRCFPRLRRILPAFRPNKYTFSLLLTASSSSSESESEDDARRLVCCIHGLAVVVGCDSSGDSEGYVSNGLIHAYAGRGMLCSARRLFQESISRGRTDVCSWTSLVTAYGKAGQLDQARALFDGMPHRRNDVAWSAMLSAYVAAGGLLRALQLFQEMQRSGVRPNRAAVVGALAACGALGALEQGTWLHAYCLRLTQIGGGGGAAAAAVRPNAVTFICVLTACARAGLVHRARHIFRTILPNPGIEHYGCLVDVLARAGLLDEALHVVRRMPMRPDSYVMGALLNACTAHGHVHLGRQVMAWMADLGLDNHSGVHVQLSNMYAGSSNWEHVLSVRNAMEDKQVLKLPGCSMVEVDGVACEFVAGDRSHPRMRDIISTLTNLHAHRHP